MVKESFISSSMKKNHEKIERLLEEFKKSIGKDMVVIKSKFKKFKWELEKHTFIEEKAIFTFYNPEKDEEGEYSNMADIEDEHDEILETMSKIEKDLEEGRVNRFMVSEMQELLKKHQEFEDEFLYPKLDKKLNASQKKIISEKVKEIAENYSNK